MRVDKGEISQKIGELKSVVPKKSNTPVMQSILVKDGYLIGSNQEMTVQAKLEGAESELFLIPAKAFDLIQNLPDGEVEITADAKNVITIKAGKIKNTFASKDPKLFSTGPSVSEELSTMTVDSKELKECMSHVLYAVAQQNSNQMMCAMCLDCHDGYLNFAGLDGRMIAWDRLKYDGEYKMLIPRAAVQKMISLDIVGPVSIQASRLRAIFSTDEYIVETRLVEGKFFPFQKMFNELNLYATVNRKEMLSAINRADICRDDSSKEPIRIDFEKGIMKVYLKGKTANYSEEISLSEEIANKVTIAFNPKLLMDTLKAFGSTEIRLNMIDGKNPMIVKADDCELQSVVLPVNTAG